MTSATASPPASEPELRRPVPADAIDVWRLASATADLDDNSPYAYLLLCSDFADDSLVAVRDGALCGFVMGYRPPRRSSETFVWQVCVNPSERGRGLAQRMLRELVQCAAPPAVRTLSATVTPENSASRALFLSFAREMGAPVAESLRFESRLFPQAHQDEVELRIGPFQQHCASAAEPAPRGASR